MKTAREIICVAQPCDINGGTATVSTTRGDFLVDVGDLHLIVNNTWNIATRGCVEATDRKTTNRIGRIKLHVLLLGKKDGMDIDHINGNPLDNRRSNLRHISHKDNSRNCKLSKNNTSGFNGVNWVKSKNKWRARIKHDYKNIFLGYFHDKEDAKSCRYAATIALFGDYGRRMHE